MQKYLVYLVILLVATLVLYVFLSPGKLPSKATYELQRECSTDAQAFVNSRTFASNSYRDQFYWHYNTSLNKCLLHTKLTNSTEAIFDVNERRMIANFAYGGMTGVCVEYVPTLKLCNSTKNILTPESHSKIQKAFME
jgi:hypothetical protein